MGIPNLSDVIQNQIDNTIRQLPVNQQCRIIKTYEDNFADIQITDTNDVLKYVEVIGENKTGVNGLLVFVNGELNNPVVITGGVIGEGGDVDLKEYVKKKDVDLLFDLEDNGTITIGIDVGDGF
nr:hypothetical protein [uncultured Methanobrevibacter sp.]